MGIAKIKNQKSKIKNQKFLIIAMSPVGEGLSGGDRIFIELARNFSKMGLDIQIITWEDGVQMLIRQRLINAKRKTQNAKLQLKSQNLNIKILKLGFLRKTGFLVCYVARIIRSVFEAFRLSFSPKSYILNHKSYIVYSASDFWMDALPAFILKLRYPKIKWLAAWYQTAPNPLIGYKEGKRGNAYRGKAFLYWLSQLPIKPIISHFADFVLVNNEDEKKQFPKLDRKGKVFVMLGAVDIEEVNKQKSINKDQGKIYDAVFQGRFHPQKGVLELIDIWKKVVEKKPDAKLVMIGDGPLMQSEKRKAKSEKLERNIIFKGYLFDGEKKYRIFSQSKIVVHPAFYDSGGMAAGEAMAFGLPCVGFDLKSYKSYYPKGMIKAPIGDVDKFAEIVLKLLGNRMFYDKIKKEAIKLIDENWSWEKRAEEILRITDEN